MKKRVVVETLTHSINRRHGGSGRGDRTVSPRYPYGWFFLQAHVDLSLRLTEGYTQSHRRLHRRKALNGMAISHSWQLWTDLIINRSVQDFVMVVNS
jgi:hypothetical protein